MGTRAQCLTDIYNWYTLAVTNRGYAQVSSDAARTQWNIPNDHLAIHYTINAVNNILNIFDYMLGKFAPYSPSFAIHHFLYYHTVESGAADMDSILNAMLGATFAQLQQFIGIEDAYRVALWNAPFNADFYAALARGFVSWA